MNRLRTPPFIALASAAAVAFSAGDSLACGGFFCSAVQPVNQAAERIVFSENGDGTVTAVIQILYEGPAESFSWLLPISSVPEGDDLAVASDVVFQRLQQRTNPTYTLIRRVEGECAPFDGEGGAPGSGEAGAGGARGNGGPVSVEARGVIGNFEWEVISVAPGEENPTEVAVTWLADNGYDVPEGTPGLLRPYLEEGLYLLALRLTKGSDTGSIRPIVVTYSADRPGIPIRPTAVAANENMGVMTWVLGQARAVPQNYLSLELNEARLNWFNPSSNYDALVTAAADEAGGQGFVTEFAGNSELISETVWSSYDEDYWQNFVARQSDAYAFQDAYYTWGGWDGFWEATRATLSPPPGETSWDDVIDCPECTNLYGVSLDGTNFVAELEAATSRARDRVRPLTLRRRSPVSHRAAAGRRRPRYRTASAESQLAGGARLHARQPPNLAPLRKRQRSGARGQRRADRRNARPIQRHRAGSDGHRRQGWYGRRERRAVGRRGGRSCRTGRERRARWCNHGRLRWLRGQGRARRTGRKRWKHRTARWR